MSLFAIDRFAYLVRDPLKASSKSESKPNDLSSTDSQANVLAKEAISSTQRSVSPPSDWVNLREARYSVFLQGLAQFSIGSKNIKKILFDGVECPHLEEALELLASSKISCDFKARTEIYPRVMQLLRKAVKAVENGQYPNEARLIHELCLAAFTVDIKDSNRVGMSFINGLLGEERPNSIGQLEADKLQSSLQSRMDSKPLRLKLTDAKRKVSANCPLSHWDPASYSVRSQLANAEFKSSLSDETQSTTLLRTACPVIGSNKAPQVDPIFVGMLRALKAEGIPYLYINNQSADQSSDSRPIESELESARVLALRQLANSEEFKETFFIASFAHDSTFYKANSGEFGDVKSGLTHHLLAESQGYFLPSIQGSPVLDEVNLKMVINRVQKEHFKGKVELNAEERKKFLHACYAAITLELFVKLKIQYGNITCKDGVDRAAGSAANLLALQDNLPSLDVFLWVLTMPATLNHARPPKASRHTPSIATLKMITSRKQQESEAAQAAAL